MSHDFDKLQSHCRFVFENFVRSFPAVEFTFVSLANPYLPAGFPAPLLDRAQKVDYIFVNKAGAECIRLVFAGVRTVSTLEQARGP